MITLDETLPIHRAHSLLGEGGGNDPRGWVPIRRSVRQGARAGTRARVPIRIHEIYGGVQRTAVPGRVESGMPTESLDLCNHVIEAIDYRGSWYHLGSWHEKKWPRDARFF
jgi:hypothetical protein